MSSICLLFICSKNQWRSPTAEKIFQKHPLVDVRSAGTARSARRQVQFADILWAVVIFVMEQKHASRLRGEFRAVLKYKELVVLDIPDEFRFMDPELIELLTTAINPSINS